MTIVMRSSREVRRDEGVPVVGFLRFLAHAGLLLLSAGAGAGFDSSLTGSAGDDDEIDQAIERRGAGQLMHHP
jgi:hypothetical protein